MMVNATIQTTRLDRTAFYERGKIDADLTSGAPRVNRGFFYDFRRERHDDLLRAVQGGGMLTNKNRRQRETGGGC